jgi:hypothetical protein
MQALAAEDVLVDGIANLGRQTEKRRRLLVSARAGTCQVTFSTAKRRGSSTYMSFIAAVLERCPQVAMSGCCSFLLGRCLAQPRESSCGK